MVDGGNSRQDLLSLTTEIVASFAGNNTVAVSDLPTIITSVFQALQGLGQAEPGKVPEALVPAVPIRKSVSRDHLVCLEDGRKLKTLKRYLANRHGLTPAQYRERWNLPKDYPMVAPGYAQARSELAKAIGLGRKPAPAAAPAAPTVKEPIRRAAGRRRPKPAVT